MCARARANEGMGVHECCRMWECVDVGARARACACLRVALFSMPRVGTIFSAASQTPPYFSTLSHKRHDFRKRKKLLNVKCVFRFFLQLLFEIIRKEFSEILS